MIRGNVAALRCRELALAGCPGEARVELSLLRTAIGELAAREREHFSDDLATLIARERSLASLLQVEAGPELSARPEIEREESRAAFSKAPARGTIRAEGPVSKLDETSYPENESRREPVSRTRTQAMLVVDRGNGEESMRLIDFLRDCADDTDAFERVGALTVGRSIEIGGGDRPSTRVRRVQ
jgi:hypothetical protein